MSSIDSLTDISISGFRGFADTQTLTLARPDGTRGSGLTIIVGSNNSGKSSIIEAFTAVTQSSSYTPTFSEGKRNLSTEGRVEIRIKDAAGRERAVRTVESGGSETSFSGDALQSEGTDVFILPSRRRFDPFFGKSSAKRESYVEHSQRLTDLREGQNSFSGRLFNINSDPEQRAAFTRELGKVLSPIPDWTIEQTDQGNYYVKYSNPNYSHGSDGLGDGILSTFFIVDALYDSKPGSAIIIDEPELSLHPALQERVLNLILDYSIDRQIIISTHAPKFIDWNAISSGAGIARVVNDGSGAQIKQLSAESCAKLSSLLGDLNNPHVLGLNASEVFFLSDKVVLLEGQEDVIFFPRVVDSLNRPIDASFFGWGVGGADKMGVIAAILADLGFKKVIGLVDGNRVDLIPALQRQFPHFSFLSQPADDIRFKSYRTNVSSLLSDDNCRVRPEFEAEMSAVLEKMQEYLSSEV